MVSAIPRFPAFWESELLSSVIVLGMEPLGTL